MFMKKLLLLLAMMLAIVSCKSTAVTNKKEDRRSQIDIKGDWTITSVTYPNMEYIKITSFDVADSQCFVNSTWKFVSNNNKGNISIAKEFCPSFSSPITWYVNKDSQFVMKILSEGQRAKRVSDGYILKVANQTENSFQLIDVTAVGNKDISVVYQFNKI